MVKLISETRQINQETGEVVLFEIKPITKQYIRQRFGVYFLEAMVTVADMELSHLAHRIVLRLMGELLTGSEVAFNSAELSKAFKIKRRTLWRAIRELVAKNILLRTIAPNGRTYRLNPRLVWRGSLEQRPADLSPYPPVS